MIVCSFAGDEARAHELRLLPLAVADYAVWRIREPDSAVGLDHDIVLELVRYPARTGTDSVVISRAWSAVAMATTTIPRNVIVAPARSSIVSGW